MSDIRSPKLLYLKAALLLAIGIAASVLIVLEHPGWRTAALLALAVWGFARAYYFAFYVVEHYADPEFRFSGLGAFVLYLVRKRRTKP